MLSLAADARAARRARGTGALLDGLFVRSPVGLAVFDTHLRFQQINPAPALVIGDVMGHGITAAAVMGQRRTTVRALTRLDPPPAQLLHHLDHALQELDDPVLATCLYGVCDATTGTCSFARAGHPPPAVITPDGTSRLLEMPSGAPLGIGGITYTTSEYALAPGSILVLYTDGLIEARGCDLDQRLARLTHLLSGSRHSLNGLCDLLLADLAPILPRTTSPSSPSV